ncbi:MAG TPA: monovalent cation:proton antiporter-2 (CPA2) family protein [Gammaproteobacteria bacterium]|nr:monovalent cation:proton antiporter-2 (CPA2) family protein [Gammaproteobacteria bacterium]
MSLTELLAYLVAAVIAVPVARRLGFGSVLGYLAAGIVIGPWGLKLFADVDRILHLAEFGIVLLLFIIGLELQPTRLWALRRGIFGTGSAQVLITGALLSGAAMAFGLAWESALIIGLILALSSTAFVLQLLAERKQLTTRHGRTAFTILLLQDIAVIPLLALIPMLAPSATASESPMADLLLQLGAVLALVAGGRWLLRPMFRIAARDGGHEIFTATALVVVVGSALLMVRVGLSAGLGAFLAGVLLADSEFRHELEAEIEPFKGLLLGLFFVAVGMSTNLGLFLDIPWRIVAMTAALVALKAAVLFVVGRVSGLPAMSARSLAVVLAQGGEFAFVLFAAALQGRLIERELFELLILVVTLSMIATPFLVIADERLNRAGRAREERRAWDEVEADRDHVVIIAGLGRFGQVVARVLNMRGIPFTALESDSHQVDFVRRFGNIVYYGDTTRLDLLRAAHVERAKAFVVAVEDVEASVRTVELVKHHFPHLKIFARATDRAHARALRDRHVDYVIRENYVSSLEMAENLLLALGDPPERAGDSIRQFRRFDETLLERERAVDQDEGRLVQTIREAERELAFLFHSDEKDAVAATEETKS